MKQFNLLYYYFTFVMVIYSKEQLELQPALLALFID